jgi:ubiquinone/menaquinone biosynthesis C-methylase UbiE
MTDELHYIIRGGDPGAERLRVLSRAMRAGTLAVLDRAGLAPGLDVLDLGCGSGDATVEIAGLVGPTGRVVGIDMDDRVLAHARAASDASGLAIQWKQGLVEDVEEEASFDIAYSRFVLSHLRDPAGALQRMRRAVRPLGRIVVEDIDITTHSHWPPSAAFQRYIELYAATGRARGVDPVIGPHLAAMLIDAGLEDVEVSISMPVFRTGEGKSIARLTLANIADAAISAGLTNRLEVDRLLADLATHEADPRSIQSTAQVFQVIGCCRG